jgi:hypothetical protein
MVHGGPESLVLAPAVTGTPSDFVVTVFALPYRSITFAFTVLY